jgi:type I restriction enzyme S subunit
MHVTRGFKDTELGVLPIDWDVHPLDSLRPFVTSGSRGWARYYGDHGDPFVRITNLSRDSIYPDLTDLKFVNLPAAEREGIRTQLHAGDLLVSITADIGIIGYVDSRLPQPAYINQHIALVRFPPSAVDTKFLAYFLASSRPQQAFRMATDQGAKAGMNLAGVLRIIAAFPPLPEQRAIATALSDVDALLVELDRLISKKRDLKEAFMQQLLMGKTRLSGFDGDWEAHLLGDVARIKTGKRNNEEKVEDGEYPFFVRSETVERINTYSHDCEAILVPGEGRIGDIFHYINGRFDVHQRVYAITEFKPGVIAQFLYFYMAMRFGAWAMQHTVKATVDSLRLPTFQTFEVRVPPTEEEQRAIVAVLSDTDAELSILEARRHKSRDLKQALIQELLTGRTRLV